MYASNIGRFADRKTDRDGGQPRERGGERKDVFGLLAGSHHNNTATHFGQVQRPAGAPPALPVRTKSADEMEVDACTRFTRLTKYPDKKIAES